MIAPVSFRHGRTAAHGSFRATGVPWLGLLLLSLVACGEGPLAFPEDRPDIQGQIVELRHDDADRVESIRVLEPGEEPECGIWFGVTESRIGLRDADGTVRELSPDDLEVGQTVRAWPTAGAAIGDRCPAGAGADVIEVLEGARTG